MDHILKLTAERAEVPVNQTKKVIALLEEGNTVPFIARYRKEATGSLDEVQIKNIEDAYQYITGLEQRKEEVLRIIEEQGKLDDELRKKIVAATVLQRVEDLYRPFMQKRRTRATIAKEKGLEPLAATLLEFPSTSLEALAQPFVNEEKEVLTIEDALAGARDIIAENIADDAAIRETIRKFAWSDGKITSIIRKNAEDDKKVFGNYYEYEEPVKRIVPHRTLALNRGEKENVLRIGVAFPEDRIIGNMERTVIRKGHVPAAGEVKEAITDAFKRLIAPSIEREIRSALTEKAEEQAIHVFSENLKSLLLQPPLKGNVVLGVDPAFRSGCKLAVVDETGKLHEVSVIYPHPPKPNKEKSRQMVLDLLKKYPISIIAIGNGTASRETEKFIADCLKEAQSEVAYVIVNEAGASVYSASDLARQEFPELQVEERSAVSIARRLQDPLSELVKIDPGSVGVGQYQHDVAKRKLSDSLTFVVETAVNRVGVNVNTASSSLLQYVSGLSKTVAENIVKLREENGLYAKRSDLKKVPRLGAKTYEQAIGFLRVPNAKDPFDATGIHPESYKVAEEILKKINIKRESLGTDEAVQALSQLNVNELAKELEVGAVTIKDIIETLQRPNRDPRDDYPQPLLKADVLDMKDLHEGLEMQGTVRNVVDFGAFVDIGVSEDGLVHISKLKKGFVKHPLDVVASGDIVTVWVEAVDKEKGRISLTMLSPKKVEK
ncbi:Tex family protein [Sporosarcina pasteurii]|uniref:30S ribosomal protein S1 n=1 Tax=Sporosarcina pasteurii TaxID=1474 RepID=A0A380CFL9_SPOPA|nr:Tex family protein [Sporosarcina pasteurii]MDS9472190.1 Tex family protein [Sporosarcina pasteurii]QBQ06900.1 RNA-binding transcriptional accessory protein [Sporosarcina pasteurii]SUJ19679.1 30S ribosomal protein S1 [Sporosarcina pasteurii]